MKQVYLTAASIIMFSIGLHSQTTVATGLPFTHFLTPASGVITFNVKNNNAFAIRVFRLNAAHIRTARPRTVTNNVWFRTTAVNGTPPAVTAGNWTLAGSFIHNQIFGVTGPPNVSNMAVDIPAGATYGFAYHTTDTIIVSQLTAGAGTQSFSNGNVDIIVGDNVSYVGVSPNPTLTPWGFIGEIEFSPIIACTGATVGTIVGNNGSCANEAKFYYLQGYLPRSGISYQWQVSTAAPNGPFVNTGGNTTMLARTHGASTEYIRCIASCGAVRDTTPVFTDTLNPFYWCYCASAATNTANTKIDSFRFLNVNTGSSSAACQTYTDYRALPMAKLRVGTNFSATIRSGNCTNANILNDFGAIYLDLSRNGVYDAAERLGGGTFNILTGQVFTRSIFVPFNSPLGITGLRAMVYNGTAPTSGCGNPSAFGETEDYLVDIIRDTVDAQMNLIDSMDDACSLNSKTVRFNITNIGRADMDPLSVSFSVNGGTPVTEAFAKLEKDTTRWYTFATQANVAGIQNVTIKVWANNTLDTFKINDTVTGRFMNYTTPADPIPDGDTTCKNTPKAFLRAPSTPPNVTRWYTKTDLINDIDTGNLLIVNNPTMNDTFYAKSVLTVTNQLTPNILTPAATITGNGSGIIFDVLRDKVQINSTRVRFNSAGNATIEIRNPANAVVYTKSFVVPAPVDTIVPLGARLPIGIGYRMILSNNPGSVGGVFAYNNYPLQVPNIFRITNSIIAGGYNTFFDVNITYDACVSNNVRVIIDHDDNVQAPTRNLPPNVIVCEFPDYYYDAGNSGSTYKWMNNATTQTLKATASGMYTVTVTNTRGCSTPDTSKITLKSSPIFNLGRDSAVCSNSDYYLRTGLTNAGFDHRWSTGSLDPWTRTLTSGQYSCYVLNTQTNCAYRDTINITVRPIPTVFLGPDTVICSTGSTISIAAPFQPNYEYLWDNNTTASSRTLSSTAKTWVQITDKGSPQQCKASDTISVRIATVVKPVLGNDTLTCSPSKAIGVPSLPNMIYRWSNGETESMINAKATGTYVLTVTESGTTCSAGDTIVITFKSAPPLSLGSDIVSCNNSTTINAPKGFSNYQWSTGASGIDSIVVSNNGTYTLTVTSPCGTITDNINVSFESLVGQFSLPNDTLICDTINVSIPSQPAGYSIEWSNGVTGATGLTISETGNYWVRVSNKCGSFSDAIYVKKDTPPVADFVFNYTENLVIFENKSQNGSSYTWMQSDTTFSTSLNTSFRYPSLSSYTVKLIARNHCGDTNSIEKTFDLRKAANSIRGSQQLAIEVYPNPATTELYLKNGSKNLKDLLIEMYSADGKLVRSDKESKLNSGQILNMKLGNLANGTYIMKISSDAGSELHKISVHN